MADQNTVRPVYGPAPKGKANIKMMGQTNNSAYGQDINVSGVVPDPKDNPNLGSAF